MKRHFIRYYLVLLSLVLVFPELKSQDISVNTAKEKIVACTDRTMYVAGEKLFFSALVINSGDNNPAQLSRILYCELVTPDGKKIDGRKYLVHNSMGQGCLEIPEETISGIYFLKLYTRFMRNRSTDEYKFIMLKIVNPYKTEVLQGKDAADTSELAGEKKNMHAGDSVLNFISGKSTYFAREEIRLTINGSNNKGMPSRLCLSVIPEATYENRNFLVKTNTNTSKEEVYLPETRGISLSGQLIAKESGKPLREAKINLSIIGDKDILVMRTDSSGRFFFALPDYAGNRDLFLSADDLPEITPEIFIDNDFCSRPINLPYPLFSLNEDEKRAAYTLAVNSRVSSIFREKIISNDTVPKKITSSFYGNPSGVLVMEKYIELPTLEDYFTELPVIVNIRKVQGKKRFRFSYITQAEMSQYEPLVLVDWVAVNDIGKILAMSPLEIERVELVNAVYIKGNVTYGGIISFVSKKNNFAGIDLPTSGNFVNYRFLQECDEHIQKAPDLVNFPDSRNTLYWNPAVQVNDEGTANISFKAPDTPGKYYIRLRGINSEGDVVVSEKMFVIKNNQATQ